MRSKSARNNLPFLSLVWVAHASRVLAMMSRHRLKTVSARRRNQHARRVRYPELLLNSCEELVRRDSVEPGELTAPQRVALPFNARKQWDWFPDDMSIR